LNIKIIPFEAKRNAEIFPYILVEQRITKFEYPKQSVIFESYKLSGIILF